MEHQEIYSEEDLMRERPRGEVTFRDKNGKLFEAFICHGCQTCLHVDEDMNMQNSYPHFLRLDEQVCKEHGTGDWLP